MDNNKNSAEKSAKTFYKAGYYDPEYREQRHYDYFERTNNTIRHGVSSVLGFGVWPLIFIISIIFMLSGNIEIVEKTVTVAGKTLTYWQPTYTSMVGIGSSIWNFFESALTALASLGNSLKSLLVRNDGTFNSSLLDLLSGLFGTVTNIFDKIADWLNGIFN